MKYQSTRKLFNMAVKGVQRTVRPFNAETTRKHAKAPSWSHGLTHFEIQETGMVSFCGQEWFETHAKPLGRPQKLKP